MFKAKPFKQQPCCNLLSVFSTAAFAPAHTGLGRTRRSSGCGPPGPDSGTAGVASRPASS